MVNRLRQNSVLSCKVGKTIVPFHAITKVDCERLEELVVVLHLNDGSTLEARDIDAVELMMQYKPVVVEGHRLRYGKWMWLVHNIIGHPGMQLLALLRCYKAAFWLHDVTVPRPKGIHPRTKLSSTTETPSTPPPS